MVWVPEWDQSGLAKQRTLPEQARGSCHVRGVRLLPSLLVAAAPHCPTVTSCVPWTAWRWPAGPDFSNGFTIKQCAPTQSSPAAWAARRIWNIMETQRKEVNGHAVRRRSARYSPRARAAARPAWSCSPHKICPKFPKCHLARSRAPRAAPERSPASPRPPVSWDMPVNRWLGGGGT